MSRVLVLHDHLTVILKPWRLQCGKGVPNEVPQKSHYKLDQASPVSKVDAPIAYYAIIIGAGTRFGRISSKIANFLDPARGLSARGAGMQQSAGRSRLAPPSMTARKQHCFQSSPISCTSAWCSLIWTMAMPVR
jgi:hypothetical protein